MTKKAIYLILVLLVTTYRADAQYKVRHITADDGLSRNHIHHVFRDSRGFMWFSTTKGLSRYDGYDFVHFNKNSVESQIPYDVVTCINEDSNRNLWIGTENGLLFFDYKSGEIIDAMVKLKTEDTGTKESIRFINQSNQGELWVGHEWGLTVISIDKQGNYKSENAFRSKNIYSLGFYGTNIYMGTDNGLFRLIKNNEMSYSRIDINYKDRKIEGAVNRIYNDKNFLWVGTNNGLFRYDLKTEEIKSYTYNANDRTSLSSNTVTDIAGDNDGRIFIATLLGLNIYEYNSDSFTKITSDGYPSDYALSNNFLSSILIHNEMIWIGTEKGGINLLLPEQNFFGSVDYIENNQTAYSKNPVNAIFEDNNNNLLIGTVEGGLHIRAKDTNSFKHFTHQPANTNSLSHNSVSAITQDYNDDYWIGTWGGGLNKLSMEDINKPFFKRFSSFDNGISSNFVATVLVDNISKGLFIGGVSGLDFFDISTEKIYPVLKHLPDEKAIKLVTGSYIDSRHRLWIGTGNGLFCIYLDKSDFRRQKLSYQHFHYTLTNSKAGKIEKINCIIEAQNNKIWLGSNGNGLYSLEEQDGKYIIKNFNETHGLTDNVIYGILEDETGTLWLSTDRGISSFKPGQKIFRNFSTVDGLASNQFYWDSYFKSNDGQMYFGHVAGLTHFDPLKYTPQRSNNHVDITRIAIFNQQIYPTTHRNSQNYLSFSDQQLNRFTLKESERTFSIEFSSLDYFFPEKIRYAYRLAGFDNEWKEVNSQRRFANFTNIKSGKYSLEIKCTNADGIWSNNIKTLEIRVIPPIYKTWWFLLLSLLLFLFVIFKAYQYRIKLLKSQKLQLRELVAQRTNELEQQKEVLQEQALQLKQNMGMLMTHQEDLSNKNEILIKQNIEIKRQKEEVEQLTRKVEEATVDKIAFFTNITHEFRTPITLISGPVERALKLSVNPLVIEQLEIVKRNSRLLMSLINQLMDFRKVDSQKVKLSQTQQNFIEFLEEIILPFEDLVKDRGIIFKKQFRVNPPEFLFDKNNMQKLLTNLLSNAIKFTPDRGTITVMASIYTDKSDQKEKLYFAVKDSGKGIPESDLEKIFEKFYQSKDNQTFSNYGQSGTGIGLFLCKRIVELHDGKIEAINLHSGGACFRFIIPVEHNKTTMITFDGKPLLITNDDEEKALPTIAQEIKKDQQLVLVVEDNADMRQYIRSIMIGNYNVIEAPNGKVGLEITKRYQPDLIISDIMMPEMDGIELCGQLKSDFATSHIPIILLTAKSGTDTQIESFHKGADAFLVKPFDENLLKAMIQSLTERRKRIQSSFSENMDTEILNIGEESLDKKFMDKALTVIRENYNNSDFDVSEFIDTMGISRSLLHKKLTSLAGQSASRFIRVYRLNIARELIIKNRTTRVMNISGIAYEVGFNDPKYFTRCFTKHFGIQPSAFMDVNFSGELKVVDNDDDMSDDLE